VLIGLNEIPLSLPALPWELQNRVLSGLVDKRARRFLTSWEHRPCGTPVVRIPWISKTESSCS
jgi:hypothetical protein